MARTAGLSANVNAFLDTIAVSEIGKALLAISDDGYNVVVGSTADHPTFFNDYTHHPHIYVAARDSTAAGRYQILGKYADAYITQLGLPDFGPESQDAIALQMIRECHGLGDIEAGNIANALLGCSSRWASLPGSQYGQHTNATAALIGAYVDAGGTLA